MEEIHKSLNLNDLQIRIFEYIFIAITQTCQSLFRGWNISAISQSNVIKAHISWQLYGIVWLSSLALGLKAVTSFDVLGLIIFFFFGGVGLHISMLKKKIK